MVHWWCRSLGMTWRGVRGGFNGKRWRYLVDSAVAKRDEVELFGINSCLADNQARTKSSLVDMSTVYELSLGFINHQLSGQGRTPIMSFRLPVSISQVLRHTIAPPKQAFPSRFFASQTPRSTHTQSPIQSCLPTRRPIPLSIPLSPPRSSLSKPNGSFSFLRSFSTTRQTLMRPNYFPKRGGSGGGIPKPGFFRRLIIRLERLPHTYIVCRSPSSSQSISNRKLSIDLRSPWFKHCNLFPLGIRQNLLSAIPRSISI
jgi:hypothetical protein